MKFSQAPASALNTVTAYGQDYVDINSQRFTQSIVVMPEGEVQIWPVAALGALTEQHLTQLLARSPELVLLGTGNRQQFPPVALLSVLSRHSIGLDVMDTRAACRTYNILMSEGRQVLAALIVG